MWSTLKKNSSLVDIGSAALIVIMAVLIIWKYPSLPEQVPQRFALNGKVTGYAGKMGIFSLPILAVLSMLVLYVAAYFQKLWGIKDVEEDFQEEVFLKVRLSFSLLRLELTLMIFLFAMCSIFQSDIPWILILVLNILFLGNMCYSVHITRYCKRHSAAS